MRRNKKAVSPLKTKPGLQPKADNRVERYNRGMMDGYHEGLEYGYKSFDSHFEGTSIIIPCQNEMKYVKRCIESIIQYTNQAFEIIVVDNHSSDGIEHYLKQLDGVARYHIMPQNYGFAGAANRGLMMAKGTTMLLLDNHAVVTDNWLENLLVCLQSDPDGGLAGPVSNGLNGIQQFDMEFKNKESMQKFASWNNRSDSSRWGSAEQLSAKCLLFRRELLNKVGFLDEGFQDERHAGEDFCIRAKLQGFSINYAGDAFIHLGTEGEDRKEHKDEEVASDPSPDYYKEKWIKPKELLYRYAGKTILRQTDDNDADEPQETRQGETAFYPQAIAVKGLTDTVFWIEDHTRRPVEGIWDGPVIQLSQLDLRQWKVGAVLKEGESLLKQNLVQGHSGSGIWHGTLCSNSEGDLYYLEYGMKRPVISPLAVKAWKMNTRRMVDLEDEELLDIPEGLPVIAPISLRQAL